MSQNNQSFRVGDLVCLRDARTQEVFMISGVDEGPGRGPTLFFCNKRPFLEHEIEPKPLQKGDCVRGLRSNERYEVAFVNGPNVDVVQQSKGHVRLHDLTDRYRAVSSTAYPQIEASQEAEEPSFMVGDLVRERGDGEDGCFTVRQLLDGGRTVILGDGLESQHTALEPTPFQVGDWVRSVEENLRGQVTDIVGDNVYLHSYTLPLSECRRTSAVSWPCEKKVPKVKKRTLAKVLAEIRQADAQMLSIREQRKALKKEAREAFNKVLKD